MQLAGFSTRSRMWLTAPVALALLVLGSELFFRFSHLAVVKTVSLAVAVSGLLVLAWSRWGMPSAIIKSAALLLFGLYLAGAAVRFPGLVKEPPPIGPQELSPLFFKVVLGSGLAVVLLALVQRLYLRVRKAEPR